MKLILALLTALLLASPGTQAQQAAPDKVRDRLWQILGVAGIDQGIPSAPWMRDWIKKHGDEKLNR